MNKISPKDQVSLVAGAMRHCLFSAPSKPVDTMPDTVAERLLRNLINYAAADLAKPPIALPEDFDQQLKAIGYQ